MTPTSGTWRGAALWPVRYAGTAFSILIVLVAVGVTAAVRLPVQRLPANARPVVEVRAELAGVDPAMVHAAVTQPLAQALAGVPAVDQTEARSTEGEAVLALTFDSFDERARSMDEVVRRVSQSRTALPPSMQAPSVVAVDPAAPPAAVYAITAAHLSAGLARWARNIVIDPLHELPDVARVALDGVAEGEILIQPDLRRLAGLGLSLDDIARALRQETDAPRRKSARRQVVTPGSAQAVAARAVRLPSGGTIALAEVARITERMRTVSGLRHENAPAWRLAVYPRAASEAARVAERSRAHLAWLRANDVIPADVVIHTLHEESRTMNRWLARLFKQLGIDLGAAFLLTLFIGGRRAAQRLALALVAWIPASALVLWSGGWPLGTTSVAALLLAVAPLVVMAALPSLGGAIVVGAGVAVVAWFVAAFAGVPLSMLPVFGAAAGLALFVRWLMQPWSGAVAVSAMDPAFNTTWRSNPGARALILAAAILLLGVLALRALPGVNHMDGSGTFRLRMHGEPLARLQEAAAAALPSLRAIPGVNDITPSFVAVETWRLHLNNERMREFGLDIAEVGRAFAIAREGLVVGDIVNAEQRLPLRLQLAPGIAGDSYERLLLRGERDRQRPVYLRDIGFVERILEPRERLQVDGAAAVEITAIWRGAQAWEGLERVCGRIQEQEEGEVDCTVEEGV